MTILAIDPGNTQSAYVLFDADTREVFGKGKIDNDAMLTEISNSVTDLPMDACVIEMIASYGMAVGKEVFETVFWIGRFAERWEAVSGRKADRIYRRDVKLHLCASARAKDGNIRQALIDMYGGKDAAIGLKKTPGPLYGISADIWAALAVAVTFDALSKQSRLVLF